MKLKIFTIGAFGVLLGCEEPHLAANTEAAQSSFPEDVPAAALASACYDMGKIAAGIYQDRMGGATFGQSISSFQGRWEGPPPSPGPYLTRVTELVYAPPPIRPDQAVPGISTRFGDFIEADCLSRGQSGPGLRPPR